MACGGKKKEGWWSAVGVVQEVAVVGGETEGVFSGVVTQIQRYSINDGPGIRTTVFLKGCELRCRWCHNPETWDPRPEIYFTKSKCVGCGSCKAACPVPGAIDLEAEYRINWGTCTRCMECVRACRYGALTRVGETLTVAQVMDEVIRDLPFYLNSGGGMSLSGGEPLYQARFCLELLREAKRQGLHTCLDTSGYAAASVVEAVMPYVDLVLLDIKHMDEGAHRKGTGVSNSLILENARRIASGAEVRFRIPLIPGFNDSEEFMHQVGGFARSIGVGACDILPYHDYCDAKYKLLGRGHIFYKVKLLPDQRVKALEKLLQDYGLQTTIGG